MIKYHLRPINFGLWFFPYVICTYVCNRQRIYICTCIAALSYNSYSYLTMATGSINDTTAQDDTLKKPPQPVNRNLTHLLAKENSVPCLPTSGNGYTTHKAQDVI